jgi:hypothetical protein
MHRPTPKEHAMEHLLRLAPGQTLLQPLKAGTCLQVLSGRLQLSGPARWQAGYALPCDRELSSGCCHVVERDGWVRLRAEGRAELRLLPG